MINTSMYDCWGYQHSWLVQIARQLGPPYENIYYRFYDRNAGCSVPPALTVVNGLRNLLLKQTFLKVTVHVIILMLQTPC